MTSELSFLTRAPITPRDVRRRYSNGRDLEVVFRNGYKNSGIWAIDWVSHTPFLGRGAAFVPLRKRARVSLCEATHWRRASALQTRLDAAAVNCDGFSNV